MQSPTDNQGNVQRLILIDSDEEPDEDLLFSSFSTEEPVARGRHPKSDDPPTSSQDDGSRFASSGSGNVNPKPNLHRGSVDSNVSDTRANDPNAMNRNISHGTGKYDDFETIDWVKDIARDRQRHRDIMLQENLSWKGALYSCWDSSCGWVCALLVGVVVGVIAGVVDISSSWMSDLKEGICIEQFWLNKEQCCWSLNLTISNAKCLQWYSWSRMLINKEMTDHKRDLPEMPEQYDAYFVCYVCFIACGVSFAILSVMLVKTFAPYAAGSGISEIKTILSGFIIRGFLGKWTLAIKSLGMILSVASGLSLGKEGPMVHLGSCVGNVIAHLFPKYSTNEAKKREILSASAAAGVAVAFGAPISGVLFSLEEASYYFPLKTMFRSFFCAMCAASVLRFINPFGNDHLVLYQVDYSNAQWHVFELIPFAVLGALGGIFGAIFIRTNIYVCHKRKTTCLGQWPLLEVFVLSIITLLLHFPCVYLRMNTNELIKILVNLCGPGDTDPICDYRINTTDHQLMKFGNFPARTGVYWALGWLSYALIVKIILTIFTSGTKVPAGLFIPSMAVGAIMGRMIGILVEQTAVLYHGAWIFQRVCESGMACINPGLYAMVGAAACMGGVTRMTISLVVMMLELTGSMNCIIPLMVATMMSKWVGDRLTKGSIYDELIILNNYPFLNPHDEPLQPTIAVDVMPYPPMDPRLRVLVEEGMFLGEIERLLADTKFGGYPVVQSLNFQHIVGYVSRRDLRWAIDEALGSGVGVTSFSPVYFTDFLPPDVVIEGSGPAPVHLRNIVDLSPITITDQTPTDTVFDFFVKLGLRQLLVSRNGQLVGMITKKDVLRHLLQSQQHNFTSPSVCLL